MNPSHTPLNIDPTPRTPPASEMIGASAVMQRLDTLIRRVAPSRTTLLITGESGTGKEVAAAAVHRHSARSGGFVAINCGSMSPELLDSELFGHARGAFTGATQSREGLFRHAEGGTLFLDEIGELPLFLQTKLLRVLETRMIRPVGADAEHEVDVRILAATNRALARQVEEGAFRADLFYRLNVFALRVPPLRERVDDIPALVEHFAAHFEEVFDLRPVPPGRAGLRLLQRHRWPGNVRELRNLVERALLLGKSPADCLEPDALPPEVLQMQGASGYPPDLPLAEVRRLHMERVLQACRGNKSEAARRMGISRKTLERQARDED